MIGAKKFMCIGALPPQDHPHVFCDMGDDLEYVCPYCSTLYRHNPTLAPNEAKRAKQSANCTKASGSDQAAIPLPRSATRCGSAAKSFRI